MRKKVVLDTNLSVLLCVGLTKRSYIARHKKLQAYTEADYDLLAENIENAAEIVISPNIATETSNLTRQIGDPAKTEISQTLAKILREWREVYFPSSEAAVRTEYKWLGLTDAAILGTMKKDMVLLTADHLLHVAAADADIEVINFNHLREERFGL